ncbi:hypothetical protein DFJ74DRAFT_649993 [Hyaloraphidium curvatum]|nr:hypothetical protein DFJ74DRAFT_649993 [Hyaloraphidium curvatum]
MPRLLLGPEEFRAVFPVVPASPAKRSLGGTFDLRSEEADPAHELRSEPLTEAEMLRALEPYPGLRLALRIQLSPFLSYRPQLRRLLGFTTTMIVMATIWWRNDGRFGTKQLATCRFPLQPAGPPADYIPAAVADNVCLFLAWAVNIFIYRFVVWLRSEKTSDGPAARGNVGLDGHALAPLVRWIQLVGGPASPARPDLEPKVDIAGPDSLLAHGPGDRLCPCGRMLCAGRIPGRILVDRLTLQTLPTFAYLFITYCCALWTLLFTFGEATWGTPWTCVMASLTLIFQFDTQVLNTLGVFGTSVHVLNLNARLTHRALRLHMSAFLRRYRDALEASTEVSAAALDSLPDAEPYQALQPWVATAFDQRVVQLGYVQSFYSSAIVSFVVYIVVFIATGSCIPLGFLLTLALLLFLLVLELIIVATGNTQVSAAADLYLQARREARELATAAAARAARLPDGDARMTRLSAALARHAEVLGSFAEIGEQRQRFLGLPVSFGAVRTLCITGFTVAFGVWSILRGAGVFLTVESACPNV